MARRRPARRSDRRWDRALKARYVTSKQCQLPTDEDEVGGPLGARIDGELADERDHEDGGHEHPCHATSPPQPVGSDEQEDGEDDDGQRRRGLDLRVDALGVERAAVAGERRFDQCGDGRDGDDQRDDRPLEPLAEVEPRRLGPPSDEERSGEQADEPRGEVLDVPQQAGLEDHGDEEDADAHAEALAPHGLHHGGERGDHRIAAGRDAEVALARPSSTAHVHPVSSNGFRNPAVTSTARAWPPRTTSSVCQ